MKTENQKDISTNENYKSQLAKQFEKDIKSIEEWEKRNQDNRVMPFYKDVLHYYFSEDKETAESYVNTSLYSFLTNIIDNYDSKLYFILDLQSFLSNAVLDDSRFKICWTTIYNPEFWADKKTGAVPRLKEPIFCNYSDIGASPHVNYARDEDENGSQDIKLLEEALVFIVKQDHIYYSKHQKYRTSI